jgi:magnesium-transporting ATPase (P-type)
MAVLCAALTLLMYTQLGNIQAYKGNNHARANVCIIEPISPVEQTTMTVHTRLILIFFGILLAGNMALMTAAYFLEGQSNGNLNISPAKSPVDWAAFVFNAVIVSAIVLTTWEMQNWYKLPSRPLINLQFWLVFLSVVIFGLALTVTGREQGYFDGVPQERRASLWFVVIFSSVQALGKSIPEQYWIVKKGLSLGAWFFLGFEFCANLHQGW